MSSPGDTMIQAIAEAVALKLEKMASCNQRLLTLEQASQYLGMTPEALRRKNDVPVVKIDYKLRYDRRDLDRFINEAPREGV